MLEGSARESLRELVVFSGDHEPLIFRRRRGSARADEERIYLEHHSRQYVERLAASGVNWYRMHFFKGFGLKHERQEIDLAAGLAALCHECGIRVELYTQFGTLQYETFLDEVPESRDWVQVNQLGQPITITYGHQDFRWMPCVSRDGYWRYLQEVVRVGIEEVGADGFGFDNVALGTEPESCHCPACREGFVRFLKEKYRTDGPEGRAAARERFGFDVLDYVAPPTWNRWCQPVDYRVIISPVTQEWVQFRCEMQRRRFEQMERHIRSLSDEVVIEYNVYPPWGTNAAFWHGIDMARLLPHLDAFWNERDFGCQYTDDGRLLHRTHAYKLARAAGKFTFTSHQGRTAQHAKLAAAESLVFNSGLLGAAAAGMADLKQLRKDRPELFTGRPLGQVAMFESSRSLANNSVDTHYTSVLVTQALLAGHVPFELMFGEELPGLGAVKVLVLPDVECLPDAMAATIIDYVRVGGGLVATDCTGWYDHWRRLRPANVLEELFGRMPDLPSGGSPSSYDGPLKGPQGQTIRHQTGRGRAVYIPRVEPVQPFSYRQEDWRIDQKYWHRPENWRQIAADVTWAAGDELAFRLEGPEWIVADAHILADGSTAVHLLNYKPDQPSPGMRLFLKGRSSTASIVSPGCDVGRLSVRQEPGWTAVEVPAFDYYAIVHLAPLATAQ